METNSKLTFVASWSRQENRSGNSSRQGTHQAAQKLIQVQCPCGLFEAVAFSGSAGKLASESTEIWLGTRFGLKLCGFCSRSAWQRGARGAAGARAGSATGVTLFGAAALAAVLGAAPAPGSAITACTRGL